MVAKKSACFFPWNTMTVTYKGEVKPCCTHHRRDFALGNANVGPIEIWRGEAYARLRLGFATEGYGENMHPVCKACRNIETEQN
jgi:radical SAM protein with 4Fe4S-binding SPASM domain